MGLAETIAPLPTHLQVILSQIVREGQSAEPRQILRLMSAALLNGPAHRSRIVAALIQLLRSGHLGIGTFLEVTALFETGDGATVVTQAASEAGVPPAVAMASILPALATLLATAGAVPSVDDEARSRIRLPPQGVPCPAASGDTRTARRKTRSRIGSRTATNAAIAAAEADARATVTCTASNCTTGYACKPVPIIISINPKWRIFWTTTDVDYVVGCACIPV